MRIWLLLLAFIVLFSGPGFADSVCRSTTDCQSGSCIGGICTALVPCASSLTCQTGETCTSGYCMPNGHCLSSSDCSSGYICSSDGNCIVSAPSALPAGLSDCYRIKGYSNSMFSPLVSPATLCDSSSNTVWDGTFHFSSSLWEPAAGLSVSGKQLLIGGNSYLTLYYDGTKWEWYLRAICGPGQTINNALVFAASKRDGLTPAGTYVCDYGACSQTPAIEVESCTPPAPIYYALTPRSGCTSSTSMICAPETTDQAKPKLANYVGKTVHVSGKVDSTGKSICYDVTTTAVCTNPESVTVTDAYTIPAGMCGATGECGQVQQPAVESVELTADPVDLKARGFSDAEISEYNKKIGDGDMSMPHVAPYDKLRCTVIVSGFDQAHINTDLKIEASETNYLADIKNEDLGNGRWHVYFTFNQPSGTMKPGSLVSCMASIQDVTKTSRVLIVKNTRNMDMYTNPADPHNSDKDVFVFEADFNDIKDNDNLGPVPQMMSMVPVAVWNDNENIGCHTADGFPNKCIYPLIFSDSRYPAKPEVMINFVKEFKPQYIFGGNQLGMYKLGSDTSFTHIEKSISASEIPTKFWSELSTVVFAPRNDYGSMLLGAQLASYNNAPLITNDENGDWKKILGKGKLSVIVVDLDKKILKDDLDYIANRDVVIAYDKGSLMYPATNDLHGNKRTFANIDDVYSYLTTKMKSDGGSGKFILINPKDIFKNHGDQTFSGLDNKENFNGYTNYKEDYSEPINAFVGGSTTQQKVNAYYGDSLAAPILASARNELMLFSEPDAVSWGLNDDNSPFGEMFVSPTYNMEKLAGGEFYTITDENNLNIYNMNPAKNSYDYVKNIKYYMPTKDVKVWIDGSKFVAFQRIDHPGYPVSTHDNLFYIFDPSRKTIDKITADGTFVKSIDISDLLRSDKYDTYENGAPRASISFGSVLDKVYSDIQHKYVDVYETGIWLILPTRSEQNQETGKWSYDIDIIFVSDDMGTKSIFTKHFDNREAPLSRIGNAFNDQALFFTLVENSDKPVTTLYTFYQDQLYRDYNHADSDIRVKPIPIALKTDGDGQTEINGDYNFALVGGFDLAMYKFSEDAKNKIFMFKPGPTPQGILQFFVTDYPKYVPDFSVDVGDNWHSFTVPSTGSHIFVISSKHDLKDIKTQPSTTEFVISTLSMPADSAIKSCSSRQPGGPYAGLENKLDNNVGIVDNDIIGDMGTIADYVTPSAPAYLTVLASPRAITLSRLSFCDNKYDYRVGADSLYATIFDNILAPTASTLTTIPPVGATNTQTRVGRIFTPSIYYTTMYIANSIVQNEINSGKDSYFYFSNIQKNDQIESAGPGGIGLANQLHEFSVNENCGIDNNLLNKLLPDNSYLCTQTSGSSSLQYFLKNAQDADFVFLDGHGNPGISAGIQTNKISAVAPKIIVSAGCATGDYYGSWDDQLFSTAWLSNGAIGYYGSLSDSHAGLTEPFDYNLFLNDALLHQKNLGDALVYMNDKFSESLSYKEYNKIFRSSVEYLTGFKTLFGDPLLAPIKLLGDDKLLKMEQPHNIEFKISGGVGVDKTTTEGITEADLVTHISNGVVNDFTIELSADEVLPDGTLKNINSIDNPDRFEWIDVQQSDNTFKTVYKISVFSSGSANLLPGNNLIVGRVYDSAGNFRQINFDILVRGYDKDKMTYDQGDCTYSSSCSTGLVCAKSSGIPGFRQGLCCYTGQSVAKVNGVYHCVR